MKKNNIKIFFLTVVSLTFNLSIFCQYEWEIRFSESDTNEVAVHILVDDEGFTYLNLRKDTIDAPIPYHSEIIKLNPEGEIIAKWKPQKQDTTISIDEMVFSSNGNIIAASSGVSRYVNRYDKTLNTCIFSLNTNLELNWEKSYQYEQDSTDKSTKYLLELSNNNFILAGTSYYPYWWEENYEIYILEFSNSGDSIKFEYFPHYISEPVWDFTFNMDSTSYWIHMSNPDYTMPETAIIKEIDFVYDSINVRYYPTNHGTRKNIILYRNNTILYSSHDLFDGSDETQINAVILDTNLNVVDECIMTDGEKHAYDARKKSLDFIDPNRIFIGGTYDFPINYQPHWLYVAILNSELELVEEKYFEGDYYDDMYSISATPDSGAIICGYRLFIKEDTLNRDAWVLKLNYDFIMGNKATSIPNLHHALVYPNPSSDFLTIRSTLKNSIFSLYDSNGKLTFETPIQEHITEIDVQDIKQGIYFYQISKNNILMDSGRWVKINN